MSKPLIAAFGHLKRSEFLKVNRTALRTIEILEYIAKSQDGVSLLEIAQALDIPKSSVLIFKNLII